MKHYRLRPWFVMVLIFGLTGIAGAQPANDQSNAAVPSTGTSAQNEVQGTINAMGNNYISVTYKTDKDKGVEYDVMLPFDANIKFEHKNNLKEFAVGDIVRVTYEDTVEGEGDKTVSKRKAKVISFVSPAPSPI